MSKESYVRDKSQSSKNRKTKGLIWQISLSWKNNINTLLISSIVCIWVDIMEPKLYMPLK